MKVAIVAPCHIQPSEEWMMALFDAWENQDAEIIIVDDSDGEITFPGTPETQPFDVYGYARQKQLLEAHSKVLYALFQKFHKSAACKQFGLWRAYQLGYEAVIVIDSDCIIAPGFVEGHLKALSIPGDGWENPLAGTGWHSRGFPYSKRGLPKWAHMGLWVNELDLYGTDRIDAEPPKSPAQNAPRCRSTGAHFPFSGMNVSFVREAIPYMLFLPNFESDQGEHFTRHDDIWGGYIFQKLAKANGRALSYGRPYVFHDTVVVPEEDALAEIPMIAHEDDFYHFVDALLDLRPHLGDTSPADIFDHLGRANVPGRFVNLLDAFIFQSKAYADV